MSIKADERKTIVLCVTGSIAAFKAVEIARHLLVAGHRVIPVLTRSGQEFVGKATFNGITGEVVRDSMWDPSFAGEMHISLASQADVVLVAPATADAIARFAQGRANDIMTALVLCARTKVVVAPAMHPRMWAHPATQRNVETLRQDDRIAFVGPVVGPVANGEIGMGRMAEPLDIADAAMGFLTSKDLVGRHLVVTAGPTIEDIDPVRFIGNRSSGKMGFALADCAAKRGARVTLIAGPVELASPQGVTRCNVRGALEMQQTMRDALGPKLDQAHALIMAAAVGDYRPAITHPEKQKRHNEPVQLEFVPNPDLLAQIGAERSGPLPMLTGFAVETSKDALTASATRKLKDKRADLIVANLGADAFGRDTNRATFVDVHGAQALPEMTKTALANQILDRVRDHLARHGA